MEIKSGNRYHRFQSKTPTRQDSRGSQRDGSEKSLKERVINNEKLLGTVLTELKKTTEAVQALSKNKNVTMAPMFI